MNIAPPELANPDNECLTGIKTAILVDGGFFLKRYRAIYGKQDPDTIVKDLESIAIAHTKNNQLYRILYYDCRPFDRKVYNPLLRREIDFSTTEQAQFRNELFRVLMNTRKVALRLGYLRDNHRWVIKDNPLKKLLRGDINISDLSEHDILYDLKQKGADIRIGLDIASMAYKRLVQQIVLISGDADFVPVAKAARREGIDIILDPMWNYVDKKLIEHVDGIVQACKEPPR